MLCVMRTGGRSGIEGVTHDDRRQRIAEVAFDLIAREGPEAATIRRIAAAVGYSTTIVTHYFADKQQLLLWGWRRLIDQAGERADAVLAADPDDLTGLLTAMSAADDVVLRDWRVYFAFLEWAARDPLFVEPLNDSMDGTVGQVAALIRRRAPDCADPVAAARLLMALVQGLSLQRVMQPDSWTSAEMRAAIDEALGRLIG